MNFFSLIFLVVALNFFNPTYASEQSNSPTSPSHTLRSLTNAEYNTKRDAVIAARKLLSPIDKLKLDLDRCITLKETFTKEGNVAGATCWNLEARRIASELATLTK